MLRWLTLFVALLAVVPSARAETAFLMVPQVETERIAPEVQAEVMRAVGDALRADGVTVITVDEARKKNASCGERACVAHAVDRLQAHFGVQVTLMATPGAETGALGSLGIALYERELVYRAPAVRVLDHGIERAADEGVRTARARQRRGPGPWLLIKGTPPDVSLYLDEERVDDGDLPCEVRVEPGHSYTLVAKRPGYTTREYPLIVGADVTAAYEVSVDLDRTGGDAPPAAQPGLGAQPKAAGARRIASWKDWALGGAVVAAGVGLAINPLRTFVNDGEQLGHEPRRIQAGPRSKALLAAGAVLVVGGVLVPTVWKPFALRVDASRQGATVAIETRF